MKRPNIVWMYCDELRADALSCYGAPTPGIETPALDALAESGQIFANHFTNSPICVPARAAVLSGLYPEQTGVYGNEGAWPGFRLSREVRTFTELLADAGYATANFGKIHVPSDMRPFAHHNPEGGEMAAVAEPVRKAGNRIITPEHVRTMIGGRFPAGVEYPARRVTDNALAWIRSVDGPFCVRLSYLQPHTPVFPPPPYDTLYASEPFRRGFTERNTSEFERRFAEVTGPDALAPEDVFLVQQYYYGLVRWVDDEVARVVTAIEELGLRENTLIVFSADHGASLGEGAAFAKHTFAPHVHRVPLMLSWPGTLDRAVRSDIAQAIDLAPTVLEACGLSARNEMPGRNLMSQSSAEQVFATIGHGLDWTRAYPNLRGGTWRDGGGWPRRVCVRTPQYRLDCNVVRNGSPVPPAERDVFFCDWNADPLEAENRSGDAPLRAVESHLLEAVLAHAETGIDPATVSPRG